MLKNKKIDFEILEDFAQELLIQKGFKTVPVLQIDDAFMDFKEAMSWINSLGA